MHNHKHRKTQTLTIIARRTGPYSSSAFSSCYSIIQRNHVEYTRGNIQRQVLDENRALLLWICSKCHVEPKSIPRSVVNWIFWKKRALLWVVRNGEYLWSVECGGMGWEKSSVMLLWMMGESSWKDGEEKWWMKGGLRECVAYYVSWDGQNGKEMKEVRVMRCARMSVITKKGVCGATIENHMWCSNIFLRLVWLENANN